MAGTGDETTDRRKPRRWRVLDAVTSVRTPATVDEVTDEVHDRRAPSDPVAGLESWDRTHQRLHEVDLPALSAAGLIEFDRDRGIVTVPPEAAESGFGPANVEATHLRHDGVEPADDEPVTQAAKNATGESGRGTGDKTALGAEHSPDGSAASIDGGALPWHHLYLGATVASVLLLVASTGWIVPGVGFPMAVAAGAAVTLFGLLAIGHELSTR